MFLWEALLSIHQITYRLCNFFAVCANIIDFLLRIIDNYYKYSCYIFILISNSRDLRYERTAFCYYRKYKCKYIQLHVKMSEEPVHIFIIKYGRSTHRKVLLTTDTSMHSVRAFELYERRWGIEVIFKECRGYLGI